MYEHLRKFPRINSKNVLRVAPLNRSVEETIQLTRVVGGGGCQFSSNESFGVGSILVIRLLLITQSINPIAKVVWEKSNGEGNFEIGVEFLILSKEEQDVLAQYVTNGQLQFAAG